MGQVGRRNCRRLYFGIIGRLLRIEQNFATSDSASFSTHDYLKTIEVRAGWSQVYSDRKHLTSSQASGLDFKAGPAVAFAVDHLYRLRLNNLQTESSAVSIR